ncbi:hemerythrin domain-containing protein [Bdellovibrio sp. HCB274]|uniref:hemerythrin domain-containing protein n=1 Tax=Bdellovibrio sp. HCB274 TaxID=3394361 RepID=UPI0039B6B555
MEIYDLLKEDHEKVKGLLNALLGLRDDDDDTRKRLVAQIRDDLIPHARAEESVFYNSLRSVDSSKDLAMHGYKEHLEAEGLLRLLQVEDKTNMSWRKTAEKLRDALLHHISEEEGRMFEVARNNFSAEEATMMGDAFQKMKPEIKEEGLMGTTWDMIANMMPPRFTDSFRNSQSPPHR